MRACTLASQKRGALVGVPRAEERSAPWYWLARAKKVPLAHTPESAAEVRSQIEIGIDPVSERLKPAGIPTFRDAAAKAFTGNSASRKNRSRSFHPHNALIRSVRKGHSHWNPLSAA